MVVTADSDRRTAALRRQSRAQIPASKTQNPSSESSRPALHSVPTPPPQPLLSPEVLRRRLMLADATAAVLGMAIAVAISVMFNSMRGVELNRHLALTAVSIPAFAMGAAMNQLYRARANARLVDEMLHVGRTVLIGLAFMVLIAFAVKMDDLSRAWVALIGIWVTSALVVERATARRIFDRLRASARIRRRIVIVGTDAHAQDLRKLFLWNPALGYEAVGLIGDRDGRDTAHVIGSIDEIDHILERFNASGVVVSPAALPDAEVNSMTRRLTDAGYHVTISSALRDIDITRLRPQTIDGRSMLYVEPVARTGAPVIAKRIFDIVFSSVMVILTAPLLIVAAAAIKLTSRGPVFFRQTRVGLNGRLFTMVKLRTMDVDAEDRLADLADLNEADGPLFKIQQDPRITPVGRILRKLSIDELPQLVSVARGTMSMVGPRPALPSEVAGWDEATKERLRVMPGLTGLWQVSGRSDASFESYKRLDLYYVDNWSLTHDLMICLRTVPVVVGGRGAR
jgi:exopolysaccharide biosynthesis polyprenyl glycosylphosphotransferase